MSTASLLRPDQVRALREIFDAVDVNSSGDITASELSAVFQAFACSKSDWEVNDLVAEIDVGEANGSIDFDEFINLMTRSLGEGGAAFSEPDPGVSKGEVGEAFKYLDVDGDKAISRKDLQKAFESIGDEYDREAINEMITEVRTTADKSGGIHLSDLQAVMR